MSGSRLEQMVVWRAQRAAGGVMQGLVPRVEKMYVSYEFSRQNGRKGGGGGLIFGKLVQ